MYNKEQKTKLENSGNTGRWWSVAQFLRSDENPRTWTVIDIDPDTAPDDLAGLKNPHYSHWFKENQNPRRSSQRTSKKYEEKFARSKRLYMSPKYYMRRLLNDPPEEIPEDPNSAFTDHALNDPFTL